MCRQLDLFLNFTGKWDELLWLHEQAESRALAAEDKENAGWEAYLAGVAYQLRNQPAEVLACAARAAEHWQDSTPRHKAIAINLRGIGHKLQKDYVAAIAAYREALEIYRSISPESNDVSIALNDLAEAESLSKDYTSAERDYREALRIAKKNNHQEMIAGIPGDLAELALDREQWAGAETLAREALALAEKVGRQELIADDCHRLAKALLEQSRSRLRSPRRGQRDGNDQEEKSRQRRDLQEALALSRRAVEIYTRLRSPRLQSAQETLAEIEKAIQEKRELENDVVARSDGRSNCQFGDSFARYTRSQ